MLCTRRRPGDEYYTTTVPLSNMKEDKISRNFALPAAVLPLLSSGTDSAPDSLTLGPFLTENDIPRPTKFTFHHEFQLPSTTRILFTTSSVRVVTSPRKTKFPIQAYCRRAILFPIQSYCRRRATRAILFPIQSYFPFNQLSKKTF